MWEYICWKLIEFYNHIDQFILLGCNWKGPLSDIQSHIPECIFKDENLP